MPNGSSAATAPFTTVTGTGAAATPHHARTTRAHRRPGRREILLLAGVGVLVAVATAIARSGWYTAESDLGYWLGVAGGTAMLALFVYPLRKRWHAMREVGSSRFWFALHMTLGVLGPLAIILHSTLAFGSINATIAFTSMAMVATSGLFGRYLYGRIHHGLYGRRATLAELRAHAGMDSAAVRSKLAFVPPVEERLSEFARLADATGQAGLGHPLRLMTLGLRAMLARRWCKAEAARALGRRAVTEGWPADKLARRIASRSALIAAHLRAAQRVAQFGAFERLFSWWHVLHVPLVFMMVLSAIAHVVAVHMY